MHFILYFSYVILLLLGACTKEQHFVYKNQSQPQPTPLKTPNNLLTKHFDIPIPFSFSLEKTFSSHVESTIRDYQHYIGSQSVEKTYIFFKHELEKNDWEIHDLSLLPSQAFLYCTKRNKQCGIQISKKQTNTSGKNTALCLFISQDNNHVHKSFS